MTDDFDALFEEIAAQRDETVAAQSANAATKSALAGNALAEATKPTQVEQTATVAAALTVADSSETDNQDKPIFERLGGVVRLMHDSLRELGYDRSLSEAASQITDAQDRLEHIATLTEQASGKKRQEYGYTLGAAI